MRVERTPLYLGSVDHREEDYAGKRKDDEEGPDPMHGEKTSCKVVEIVTRFV